MEKVTKKDSLNDLSKKLESQKEYLQYLRNLISKTNDVAIIEQKENEMDQLKVEIENLEYEINKARISI
jgi:uncharacterized protein YjgD (DUF1641 family)